MYCAKRGFNAKIMTAITIQQDLNGKSFEDVAIANIQKYEPDEGYYLAFSGGKDSIVIYDLAVRAGVKFDAHFSRTTVDPPEVLKFIKENYPSVIWEKPRMSMYKLILKKGMLPTRNARFCCSELKEIGGPGRIVMLGIRAMESTRRKNRKLFEQSYRCKSKWFLNPILEWSNYDVWSYIRRREIPYCSLYDEGAERIGCILCPMQTPRGMNWDAKRYPQHYMAYLNTVRKLIAMGRYSGRTAEEVMDLWINER
jgi:phosphoadenosine phosphosulfate reductase